MKVLIGTKNPGKIDGARKAFEQYFENVEILGIPVSSTVGDQPVNEDIYQGAKSLSPSSNDTSSLFPFLSASMKGFSSPVFKTNLIIFEFLFPFSS